MDRLLLDARRLRPRPLARGAAAARGRPQLLRRAVHHARRRKRSAPAHPHRRLRRRALLLPRRRTHRLATLRHLRPDRRRLEHETRWQRPEADHRLRCDVVGSLRASVGRVHPLRLEQARLLELRGLHRRRRGSQGAGPCDHHRRLRRPARADARWWSAGEDLEPAPGRRRPPLHRRMEPPGGPRSARRGAAASGRPLTGSSARLPTETRTMHPRPPRRHRSRPLPMLLGLALLATAVTSTAATNESPTAGDLLRGHVEVLAADAMEGRLTGTEGERKAAEYLSKQLADLGVKPLRQDGYLSPFEFTSGSRDTGSALIARRDGEDRSFVGADVVQALSFSDSGTVSGELVFAGYGIRVPDSADFGYDSYATLDVEDKIVVVLRYFPEDAEGEARATLARYSGPRFKAMTARQLGAKALLMVTGPRSPNAGEVMPMTFDTAIAGSGIVAASVSGALAQELLGADRSLEEVQRGFDDANPHVAGFAIDGVEIELTVRLEREKSSGHNVLGVLPANATGSAVGSAAESVVVGAHFDHLGRGDGGNSLARADETDAVHNGADDNASGTAAVLEIVRALRDQERRRDLVVAFWSGEELGLLGASAFVDRLDDEDAPVGPVTAYVNFDMVGRARDNRLSVQAVGSSDAWPGLLEKANLLVGWDLQLQEDPYLPTDSAAFHRAEIPTLNFFTGAHEDYHRPTDDAHLIDYGELGRVVEIGERVVRGLLGEEERIAFTPVAPKRQQGGDRDSVRAFTGTIPDYATEVSGLLLSGVIAGGPAEEAGLRGGDVIVKFGAQTIANIYDYTYALDAVKIDQPVEVEYVRDGERRSTTLTPRARN
ncbi:MAG: M20/M25/M40 family metallo-hydrolase [Acidobacteria bacterium]|nr:MAG: M20/M25/M40 family metallo-hydrolase [Acidobacteriota bacterium]